MWSASTSAADILKTCGRHEEAAAILEDAMRLFRRPARPTPQSPMEGFRAALAVH